MKITVPDLGVDSAEVSEIMVKVGDTIKENDNIVLLESDKASVEVPTTHAGVVKSIAINLGDTVKQGDVLIELEAGETAQATPVAEEKTTPKPEEKVEQKAESVTQPVSQGIASDKSFNLPDLGVDSATVAEWLVAVGDMVEKDQAIILVESDKASVEVPAPVGGKIVQQLLNVGDTVNKGQAFVVISSQNETVSTPVAETAKTVEPTKTEQKIAKANTAVMPKADNQAQNTVPTLSENQVNQKLTDVYAGPAVRKITRQLGVDITQVKGTAPNGRIVKEDVFAYVKQRLQNQSNQTATLTNTDVRSGLPPLPDMSNQEIWGELEYQDLTRLQKVSIPQLNLNTYLPQVTQFDLADITDTENMRASLKDEFKAKGIGLTILAFIVKAVAYALMQNPKFNSHLSDDNSQIIVRKTVNMGIAVATDDGLIVPVIKDAQDKGIAQLAKEIGELAKKARDKKLSAKELQGASFTISSQGNLGGTYFTPLVNFPQVAILGISESTFQPRWNGKEFEPRLMLPLSLSYDHRVINGADAAVFTRYIAKLLADPRRILL